MIAPARAAAFRALRAIAENRIDLPSALALSRRQLSDQRDRALAAEIVTGSLRWQRSLDYLIEHFARRRLEEIDSEVVQILRLSLYQLLHLNRVPASAVVDDGVNLVRAARKPGASGFVNAILRSLLRERHRLPLPGRPRSTSDREGALAYLGIAHSHPEWLVERWFDRLGFERTETWVRFNNETPKLTLRANTLRATREQVALALADRGVETEPTRHAPDGLVVAGGNP
jgi:16S rRNA (cytosine967-C5)-methyltransferase